MTTQANSQLGWRCSHCNSVLEFFFFRERSSHLLVVSPAFFCNEVGASQWNLEGWEKKHSKIFQIFQGPIRCCQPKLQQEIVKMGKVKYVGVSEFSPAWTRAMHAIHPVTAMQIEWSLVTRKLVSGSLVGLELETHSFRPAFKKSEGFHGIVLKETNKFEPNNQFFLVHHFTISKSGIWWKRSCWIVSRPWCELRKSVGERGEEIRRTTCDR